jgi:predicted DNA-binding protein with PD1-like motif
MMVRLIGSLLVLGLLTGPAVMAQQSVSLPPSIAASPVRTYALRLRPGDDLRQQLLAFSQANGIEAGAMMTCVGSLTDVTLRLANQEGAAHYHGHFEIVSLVGTLSATGGSHLHLSVSDSTGRTIGGHLLDGCRIYTTAEIVLSELPALTFTRETDPTFGYKELTVRSVVPKSSPSRRGRSTGKKP